MWCRSPMKTTCEIMVQKVLPAIRAELSRTMIFEHGCTQQDVADTLELSRAAVSQYVSEKRGAEVGFSEETQNEIRKFASVLLSPGLSSQEKAKGMCGICSFVQKSGWLYRNAPEAKACIICQDTDLK
jgi:predicted transcriptional regulator